MDTRIVCIRKGFSFLNVLYFKQRSFDFSMILETRGTNFTIVFIPNYYLLIYTSINKK